MSFDTGTEILRTKELFGKREQEAKAYMNAKIIEYAESIDKARNDFVAETKELSVKRKKMEDNFKRIEDELVDNIKDLEGKIKAKLEEFGELNIKISNLKLKADSISKTYEKEVKNIKDMETELSKRLIQAKKDDDYAEELKNELRLEKKSYDEKFKALAERDVSLNNFSKDLKNQVKDLSEETKKKCKEIELAEIELQKHTQEVIDLESTILDRLGWDKSRYRNFIQTRSKF